MDASETLWPLVSVVIPAYNAERYIDTALRSIAQQSYPHLEVIVVDDGSTDRTAERVNAFQAATAITLIRQPNSGGPSIPRNVGLEKSNGECVFIFDADDVMLPGKLEETVAAYRAAKERQLHAGLYCTDFRSMDEEGTLSEQTFLLPYSEFQKLEKQPLTERGFVIPRRAAYEALAYENFIGTSSVMLPRFVIDKGFRFDSSLKNSDDLDLWFKLLWEYDLVYLDIVGHGYREHPENLSHRRSPELSRNRLVPLQRQLSKNISKKARNAILTRVHQHWYSIGYAYEGKKEYSAARKIYWEGLLRYRHKGFLRALFASVVKELREQ